MVFINVWDPPVPHQNHTTALPSSEVDCVHTLQQFLDMMSLCSMSPYRMLLKHTFCTHNSAAFCLLYTHAVCLAVWFAVMYLVACVVCCVSHTVDCVVRLMLWCTSHVCCAALCGVSYECMLCGIFSHAVMFVSICMYVVPRCSPPALWCKLRRIPQ